MYIYLIHGNRSSSCAPNSDHMFCREIAIIYCREKCEWKGQYDELCTKLKIYYSAVQIMLK